MKQKSTYSIKRIRYYRGIYLLSFTLALIYIIWLGKQDGFEEIIKYLLGLSPALFLIGFAAGIDLVLEPYLKGWVGENKVEKILKKFNVSYDRNIKTQYKDYEYDYDFILYIKNKAVIVEVKNHWKIEGYQAAHILTTTKNRAEIYKKEPFAQSKETDAIVVLTDAYPEEYENTHVMDLETFKTFLERLN